MSEFWDSQWATKELFLKEVDLNKPDFRRDPRIMSCIQTLLGEREGGKTDLWLRLCKEEGVPEHYWDDTFVGDPEVYEIEGHRVNPSSLRHAYSAHKILNYLGTDEIGTVLEIGGGYGGFVRALLQRFKVGRWFAVDHPTVLTIQRRFLSEECPNMRVTYLEPKDLTVVEETDLFVNQSSFGEMDPGEVAHYISHANKITNEGGAMLLANKTERRASLWEYPFDDGWNIKLGLWADNEEWFELWARRTRKGPGEPIAPIRSVEEFNV